MTRRRRDSPDALRIVFIFFNSGFQTYNIIFRIQSAEFNIPIAAHGQFSFIERMERAVPRTGVDAGIELRLNLGRLTRSTLPMTILPVDVIMGPGRNAVSRSTAARVTAFFFSEFGVCIMFVEGVVSVKKLLNIARFALSSITEYFFVDIIPRVCIVNHQDSDP